MEEHKSRSQPEIHPPGLEECAREIRELISIIDDSAMNRTPAEAASPDPGALSGNLRQLRERIESSLRESTLLFGILGKINSGVRLQEVLDYSYETLHSVIPYDRIGFALMEDEGSTVRAFWARSEAVNMGITADYSAPIKGSSLQQIIHTGRPRIINDLEEYLKEHPDSESTRKIVAEGMLSSLTCPLIARDAPLGFLFFSSMRKNTYRDLHVDFFMRIAAEISVIVEKARLYQRLEDLNNTKNRIIGTAAHDLRNPLGVVQGFCDILLTQNFGSLNENQTQYLERMRKRCASMLSLINGLLDVAAIDSGKIELKLAPVNLEAWLHQHLEDSRVLAESRGLTLVSDIIPPLPEIIMDQERIEQVLNNLLSNAMKYSYKGGLIVVQARHTGEHAEIAVTDQGQGIPAGDIPGLCREFSIGSARSATGEKSAGLGLAIVRRILDMHEGRLQIDSAPGKGSTFTISLPVSGPRARNKNLVSPTL